MKLVFVILLFAFNMNAQDCSCSRVYDNLVYKIENEYPGYGDKIKDTVRYDSFKYELKVKSHQTSSDNCLALLNTYVSYFKDKHIWVMPDNQVTTSQKSDRKVLNMSTSELNNHLFYSKDSIEGIWYSENYRVALIKQEPHIYHGYLLTPDSAKWKEKEIKFKLNTKANEVDYVLQNYEEYTTSCKLSSNAIIHIAALQSTFIKEGTPLSNEELTLKTNKLKGFFVERLSDRTMLIKLSNFNYNNVQLIESLIKENIHDLRNSDFLILDLRDNGGGTDNAYQKILPLLYTNPVRSMGVEYLVTETLITSLKTYKAQLNSQTDSKDITRIEKYLKKYDSRIGDFVNPEDRTFQIDTIMPSFNKIRNVVILSNENVGSAAENLLLIAKQGKKVKIMGTPSAGGLDYASARWFDLGCTNYRLMLPTYRSLRLPKFPIDNIGVQPDIFLDDSVTNWIRYAKDYLEN